MLATVPRTGNRLSCGKRILSIEPVRTLFILYSDKFW